MEIFLAVAGAHGLAAAARQLGVSQATVSRSLGELEGRLGTPLLTRSTRGVHLTSAGRRFASDCARLLCLSDAADASAKGLHVEPRGRLNLTMPRLFADRLWVPVVLEFLDAWTEVDISLTCLDRFPNLHEDNIDVAVWVGVVPDAHVVARRVGAMRQMICASPGYLGSQGVPLTLDDLPRHRWVTCSAEGQGLEGHLACQGAATQTASTSMLRCTTQAGAIESAIGGAGLIRCLRYQVIDALDAGRLQPLLETLEPAPLPVHLVYREGRHASARVRSFVDFASERLRAHPALTH